MLWNFVDQTAIFKDSFHEGQKSAAVNGQLALF